MDPDEYRRMARASHAHWWYRSTRELLRQLLAEELATRPQPLTMLLDAGGGTGSAGSWLADLAPTTIADIDHFAVAYATQHHPGYRPVLADLNQLPFASGTFDVVLCVTALCHRMNPDPAAIVADLARLTAPGGVVILLEPGVPGLRRGHDVVTHTARRFAPADLAALCERAGLTVSRRTGAYAFLLPPAWVLARVERGEARSDLGRNETGLFGLFELLARWERRWLAARPLPTGLSSVVVARQPG
jgi:SAM-dependent methyltransferase